MQILESELQRAAKWQKELEKQSKSRNSEEYKKLQKRFRTLIRKQDNLFRIGLYLLLNLAELPEVQYKMRGKGIVPLLIEVVKTRTAPPVLLLAISFLQKMSIFVENKNEMKRFKVRNLKYTKIVLFLYRFRWHYSH